MRTFFAELRRRNVFQAAAFYVASASLLVQVFPFFKIADWLMRWVGVAAVIGFPFWVLVAWFYQWTPQGPQREREAGPLEPDARPASQSVNRWILAILAVSVVLLLTDKFVLRDGADQVRAPEKSIAVLPFVDMSPGKDQEHIAEGVAEEIRNALAQLTDLKVIGRTSSSQFKGKTEDSKTIGEKLGADYLLEGSVQKSANWVRITVALIKSSDGANVWSEPYLRELRDIFAVQSEIAGVVVKRLEVNLPGTTGQIGGLALAGTPPNQSVQAYNAFFLGNLYHNRRTDEDLREAIGYYEEAIRLDPRYALAYAKLSLVKASQAINFGDKEPAERAALIAESEAAAKKALELNPNLADAHGARAVLLLNVEFKFADAEAAFRRALQLAPQNPAVRANLADLMATFGQLDKAVGLMQRAIAVDPLRTGFHFNLAGYLAALGRYDEAEAAVRNEIALQPSAAVNYRRLAEIQILRGDHGTAVESAKLETNPVWRTHALALAHFANRDLAEADLALRKLIEENAGDCSFQIAQVYALRREPEKMFEWLDLAWTKRDPGVADLLGDPFLRAYKDDPRFIAFAQEIGVMPKTAAQP